MDEAKENAAEDQPPNELGKVLLNTHRDNETMKESVGGATFSLSAKLPRRDETRCGRTKTSKRWSRGEVASAKALQQRNGDRPLPGTSAKGTRRRYKGEGTPSRRGARDSPGEVPGPKPRSKASGGEGPGARLRPTCRASCNPLNGCRLDVT